MARILNQGVLPPGFYTVPLLDRDGPIEIDVATLHSHEASDVAGSGRALEPWSRLRPRWQ